MDSQPAREPHAATDHFDVIVIGAGSTGTNVAGYARDNGLSVAIVEQELVGGECSYWACMPSKALLGPPNAVAAARRLPGAAAAVSGSIDVAAVLDRRDDFISHLDDASQIDWVESIGAELIKGRGRIVGVLAVEVTDEAGSVRRLSAERGVVVATGSSPAFPPIEGLADVGAWDNRDVTTADEVPARLAVLGGGVVGCEMAQAYSRLGADVTIIERGDRILSTFDPWVSDLLSEAFDDDGIHLRISAEATKVHRRASGDVVIALDDGTDIVADELLVATGRTANTAGLGLESVGIEPDGSLDVDDELKVTAIAEGWLYAAGDVNGRALLTHQGKYQARCIGDTLAGRGTRAIADHGAVPQVVFTDPEIASVGTSGLDAAGDDGLRTVSVDMSSVAGASLTGDSGGRAALVIDDARDLVVGAHFVGPNVGELLHSATVAIVGAVPLATLWHAVPAYPTVSEVWLRLLEADRGVNE